ncbi:MAG: UDP-N-acetylmuramate dehydrogenase [Bacteroidales bacterium]|nr:UDP-N-acetylmuramate dehydrogenase [Bacteroidales bacterium]MDD3666660.1 UDP-N-acetylmuramate dehydrogenase [Bacteroidales bacterium]
MEILRDHDLKAFNSFGISSRAAVLARACFTTDVGEGVRMALQEQLPLKILGGGSNILLRGEQVAFVMKMEIPGLEITRRDGANVYVTAGAGCEWEQLINFALSNHLWGIENLTLIPGRVGSSPIQNIGAYGVELKDVFHSLVAYDRHTSGFVELGRDDCRFGYRQSIFKSAAKGRYIITQVTLKLSLEARPVLRYSHLNEALSVRGISNPELTDVVELIRSVRQTKLPDPLLIGSAGSFFKNPVVKNGIADVIKASHADAPVFDAGSGYSKLAAGWLIEQCGWKGFRDGDAGVWPHQALVLVNYGKATGVELSDLANRIIESVSDRFGVDLEPEVNFW